MCPHHVNAAVLAGILLSGKGVYFMSFIKDFADGSTDK